MERRPYGRDLSLTLRMLFVSLVLAGVYSVLGLLVAIFVVAEWREWEAWLLSVFFVGGIWAHYRTSDELVLGAARARVVGPKKEPELHAMLERLCTMADLPKPRVAVSEATIPNAFAAGRSPRRAVVVVTGSLRERLEPAELESVLAHELAHIANRDAFVVTAASLFPVLGAYLGRWRFAGHDFTDRERDFREYLVWPFLMALGLVLYGLGAVLTFAISRYREYAADRGSALITGRPEQLMSALQKVSSDIARIPKRDLRALAGLNAFFIVPAAKPRRWEISMDHPPLEKRLRELSELAREMGRPVR